MIRAATREDIPTLIDMGRDFYEKSNFETDGFDNVQFAYTLGFMMEVDTHHILIHDAGFIIFDCARHYTKYKVAHLFLLYVDIDKKVPNLGRKLIDAAVEVAKEEDCKYFYGSSSAGYDDDGRNERVLKYIYKKQGFEDNGFFVRKEI